MQVRFSKYSTVYLRNIAIKYLFIMESELLVSQEMENNLSLRQERIPIPMISSFSRADEMHMLIQVLLVMDIHLLGNSDIRLVHSDHHFRVFFRLKLGLMLFLVSHLSRQG